MDELFKLLGFGTPFIYAAATYGLFNWLDAKASDEGKEAISHVLESKDHDSKLVAAALVETFDRIYSSPLLSKRAFIRSSVITLVMGGVFICESAWFRDLLHFFLSGAIPGWLFWPMLGATIVSLIVNIVSDYGSLFLIRLWLTRAVGKPAATLLIAALIGTLIIVISFGLRFALAGVWQMHAGPASRHVLATAEDFSPHMLWEAYLPALLFFPGIIVFAWLPLFAAGIVLLRMINPLLIAVRKAQWFFKDGKDHPLEAIGLIASVIVFALAVVWQVFFKAATA
jgi:hypothetical protein